jgi:protein-S-isoprenylcysteine O-methyltransferase Ste14
MAKALLVAIWIIGGLTFVLMGRQIQRKRERDPQTEANRRSAPKANRGLILQAVGFFFAWFRWPATHPTWVDEVALGIALLSAIFSVLAVRELGLQWRIQAVVTEHHKLITTGPYSLVRNPIYTSLLGMLIATGLIMSTWYLTVLAAILYLAGTEIRVHQEEKLLREKFGAEFNAYCSRVPAYLPFIR